jgi:hypothetical protein
VSKHRRTKYHERSHKWKVAGALALGAPFVVAGLLVCATLIGMPIGLGLLALSALPLFWVEKGYMRRMEAWQKNEQPTHDETPPWLLEENLSRSDETEPDA